MSQGRWSKYKLPRLVPGFRLEDVHKGKFVRMADFKEKRIVLTFLPGVWAPWCRKLLLELNQNFPELIKDHILFVAVISQDSSALKTFINENDIHFDLLSDPHGVIGTRFGVFDEQVPEPMEISKPSIFILDKHRHIISSFIGKHLADRPRLEEIVSKAEEAPDFVIPGPSIKDRIRNFFNSLFRKTTYVGS